MRFRGGGIGHRLPRQVEDTDGWVDVLGDADGADNVLGENDMDVDDSRGMAGEGVDEHTQHNAGSHNEPQTTGQIREDGDPHGEIQEDDAELNEDDTEIPEEAAGTDEEEDYGYEKEISGDEDEDDKDGEDDEDGEDGADLGAEDGEDADDLEDSYDAL